MERILYATDLEPHSDRALQRAMMLAVQNDAELLVFHATDKSRVDVKRQISELDDQIVKIQLPGANAGERSLTDYDVMVVSGNPIDELIAATDQFQPDLVVMGPSRELTPVTLFYGTTVDKAVSRIKQPILVVKQRPYSPYRNGLIAFDHTLGARQALELAIQIAPDADFKVMRVIATETTHAKELENLKDMVSGHVGAILDRTSPVEAKDANVEILIETGNVGERLLDSQTELEPDILAFGRSNKTGLKSLFPGSTASLLLGHAVCDVLIAGQSKA